MDGGVFLHLPFGGPLDHFFHQLLAGAAAGTGAGGFHDHLQRPLAALDAFSNLAFGDAVAVADLR